jgi:hypothetical protein
VLGVGWVGEAEPVSVGVPSVEAEPSIPVPVTSTEGPAPVAVPGTLPPSVGVAKEELSKRVDSVPVAGVAMAGVVPVRTVVGMPGVPGPPTESVTPGTELPAEEPMSTVAVGPERVGFWRDATPGGVDDKPQPPGAVPP